MNNYIENLKTKPDHIKKRFAFIVSLSFSLLLLVGWIASYAFQSPAVVADTSTDEKAVIETPVSSVTASVIGAFSDLKNIFFSSNKVEYSADVTAVPATK